MRSHQSWGEDIGSLAGNLAMIGTEAQPTNPTLQWAIRILGLIATVAVTVYVTRIARKALEEELSGRTASCGLFNCKLL